MLAQPPLHERPSKACPRKQVWCRARQRRGGSGPSRAWQPCTRLGPQSPISGTHPFVAAAGGGGVSTAKPLREDSGTRVGVTVDGCPALLPVGARHMELTALTGSWEPMESTGGEQSTGRAPTAEAAHGGGGARVAEASLRGGGGRGFLLFARGTSVSLCPALLHPTAAAARRVARARCRGACPCDDSDASVTL